MDCQSGIYFPFRLSAFRLKLKELARCYSLRVSHSLQSCQLRTLQQGYAGKGAADLSGPDEIVNAD